MYIGISELYFMYLPVVSVVEVVTADIQGKEAVDLGENNLAVGMPPSLEDAD